MPVDCSVQAIMSGLVPSSGNQPHRLLWWNTPASSRIRLVIGDDQSAVSKWWGMPHRLLIPGDLVALMNDGHLHWVSFVKANPNLFFAFACHVRRPSPTFQSASLETRWLWSRA